MALVHPPTEVWDDSDFDFNAQNHDHPQRLSSASSQPTEDWDKEDDQDSNANLSTWVEPGPSTPSRRLPASDVENWDDDFEDKLESPDQKGSRKRVPKQRSASGSRLENWDEDFDLSPVSTPAKQPIMKDDAYEDDDDNELDFNAADGDEDHTVTARSRRAALSRLSNNTPANASPPPPVPPIPFNLLSTAEQPFPRSPTASVFSVPTSGRDSVAYSYYHNNSTTHLRPTMSRTSMTGLANLPPSPPIHKERERRRLRKKSRPSEPAYEMTVRNPPMLSSRESLGLPEEDEPMTSSTPPPTSPDVSNTPSSNRNSTNFSSGLPPSTPGGKTPLLSRIGSVKKWSSRKKRSSSTPSEVILQQTEYEQGSKYSGMPPPSSSPPSGKSNWFFRSAGQGPSPSDMAIDESDFNTPRKPTNNNKAEDTSAKLVKRKSFGFVPIGRQPVFNNDRGEDPIPPMPGSQSDLPSDLEIELKTDSDIAAGRSPSKKKKRSSQPPQSRHASYGGIGIGRASAQSSTDDLPRIRSYSRSKSRDKRGGPEEMEGSRSFMGSVRRISLVGRHKRTKSGVSLSGVEEGLRNSTEPPPPPPPPIPSNRHNDDDDMDMDAEPPGTRTPSRTSKLLPPIELQPPSPPRRGSDREQPTENLDTFLLPSSSSSPPKSPSSPSLVLRSSAAKASPQSASLGRSTVAPNISINTSSIVSGSVPRRNSLGDLKIPARITRAQDGLRRDLSMVREFAAHVELLKELLTTYNALVFQVQNNIDVHVQQSQSSSRAASPIFRPLSRVRSTTPATPNIDYKHMASTFYTIKSKYKVAWECAELLIELAGGPPASTSSGPGSAPSTSTSAPAISQTQRTSLDENGKKGTRERAVTLSGEESKPPTPIPGAMPSSGQGPPKVSPPNMAWRASTGRHDLNQRQLLLLREMLNNPDSTFVAESPDQGSHSHLPFDDSTMVNRDWRWGEAMNSTVTLPSEESSAYAGHTSGQGSSKISSEAKKRRTSRLGMSGLRDMLKMLTRSSQQNPPPMPSTTSLSTESSLDSQNPHKHPQGKVPTYGRRRAKTSTGPDSVSSVRERDAGNGHAAPYNAVNLSSLSVKSSPRRPSLASIFRIGNKTKSASTTSSSQPSTNASNEGFSPDGSGQSPHTRESSSSTNDIGEEDWDRIDSPDLEPPRPAKPAKPDAATIRGRSPYMQNTRLPSTSSSGSHNNNHRPETPKRSASASQTSLWGGDLPSSSPITASASGGIPSRTTRLSNVKEHVDDGTDAFAKHYAKRTGTQSPVRTRSGRLTTSASKTGSVRSMPPQPLGGVMPDTQLAMTPENIKPLLENAKEVLVRLTECINEVRALLVEP
ncbi:hypothetical protein K435DRAFT_835195 [Dendrothele bispora CBS 962.96]|uniref:Uncharacterized protein n=1 Tax=Dendrothele bispora (strain CBS 962.96) TaxID=1314807 RepID=A0A4S8MQ88_DENBC|nr:hypothetical protein K435DRAFT_835195 [Dendrothele bispora CBS 962.96]